MLSIILPWSNCSELVVEWTLKYFQRSCLLYSIIYYSIDMFSTPSTPAISTRPSSSATQNGRISLKTVQGLHSPRSYQMSEQSSIMISEKRLSRTTHSEVDFHKKSLTNLKDIVKSNPIERHRYTNTTYSDIRIPRKRAEISFVNFFFC